MPAPDDSGTASTWRIGAAGSALGREEPVGHQFAVWYKFRRRVLDSASPGNVAAIFCRRSSALFWSEYCKKISVWTMRSSSACACRASPPTDADVLTVSAVEDWVCTERGGPAVPDLLRRAPRRFKVESSTRPCNFCRRSWLR